MTRYLMYVENMGDEEWDEAEEWDVRLGFDEEFKGYWLTIEDYHQPAQKLEDYMFHNLRDFEGVRMTLSDVEIKLAEYGIGLPYELAGKLIEDGVNGSYIEFLEKQNAPEKIEDFREFYQRAINSSPRMWEPYGKLPTSWEVD